MPFFKDKIAFSSSIPLLEQVIQENQNYNIKLQVFDCLASQDISSDFMHFNPKSEFNDEFGIKSIIITSEKACIY